MNRERERAALCFVSIYVLLSFSSILSASYTPINAHRNNRKRNSQWQSVPKLPSEYSQVPRGELEAAFH